MMTEYLITLSPIDKFFFGGDMTFPIGKNEKDEFNSKYSSYIIKSSYFPQQTSLIGMLRFLLLSNSSFFKDGKISDKIKAAGLIGARSFRVNDGHQENDFGPVLKKITACRLQKMEDDGRWLDMETVPMDFGLKISLDNKKQGTINGNCRIIPENSGYDAKNGLKHGFIVSGTQEVIPHDKIFIEDRRLGIDRNIGTGKTETNALYKQICYRFRKGYRFAFSVTADDEKLRETLGTSDGFSMFDGQIVSVGGDGSRFMINVSKSCPEAIDATAADEHKAVILTSPAYLDAEDIKDIPYAITGTIPFRFIKTEVETTHSYNIVNNKNSRSTLYNLYAAGSVFYFESASDAANLAKALESKKEFRQIGYNQYKLK